MQAGLSLGDATWGRVTLGLLALFVTAGFFAVDANGTQSGDAWICYLPAASALLAGDFAGYWSAMSLGLSRPPLLPALLAGMQAVLRGLSLPQTAALSLAVATFATGALVHRNVRDVGPLAAATAMVLVIGNAAVVPYAFYTMPDMLFAALAVAVGGAIMRDRPALVVALFGLFVFTKGAGQSALPAIVLYLIWRTQRGLRLWPLYFGAVAAVLALGAAHGRWLDPSASVWLTPARYWHQSIFAEGAGGTLESALRLKAPEQWGRFLWRGLITGPADLAGHAVVDRGLTSWLGGSVLALSAIAGTWRAFTVAYVDRWRAGAVLATILLGLCFYAPMIAFHWETRYWLPLYAGAAVGRRFIAPLVPRRAAILLLALLLVESAANLVTLTDRFGLRATPGLTDTAAHPSAQTLATEVHQQLLADRSRLPVRVLGCAGLSMQYSTYDRQVNHAAEIQCVGRRFRLPVTWDEVDFAVLPPKVRGDPELYIAQHGTPLRTLPDKTVLYRAPKLQPRLRPLQIDVHADPAWQAVGAGLRLDPSKPHRWRAIRTATVGLRRGDVIKSAYGLHTPARIRHSIRASYLVDGVADEPTSRVERRTVTQPRPRSLLFTCGQDHCSVAFELVVSSDERGPIIVDGPSHRVGRAPAP